MPSAATKPRNQQAVPTTAAAPARRRRAGPPGHQHPTLAPASAASVHGLIKDKQHGGRRSDITRFCQALPTQGQGLVGRSSHVFQRLDYLRPAPDENSQCSCRRWSARAPRNDSMLAVPQTAPNGGDVGAEQHLKPLFVTSQPMMCSVSGKNATANRHHGHLHLLTHLVVASPPSVPPAAPSPKSRWRPGSPSTGHRVGWSEHSSTANRMHGLLRVPRK